MNDFQAAAQALAREAARSRGLVDAAARLEQLGDLEIYAAQLEAKVADLTKALDVDGLSAQAAALTASIADLARLEGEARSRTTGACAAAVEWEAKNAAHAEAAKGWNGEAERVLAAARSDAEQIVADAKSIAPLAAEAEAAKLLKDAAAEAKTRADEYEANRKSELAELERKITAAGTSLEKINGKIATATQKHKGLLDDIAALKAKHDL